MTLHAAKGLEFNTVFIIGLEEGILPSSKSLNTNTELEEERRLFYVGITRAKERLVLLNSNYRNTYGQICDQVASRFLAEISEKLLKNLDISEKNSVQISLELKTWLEIKNNKVLTFQDFAAKLADDLENKKLNHITKKVPTTNNLNNFKSNSLWQKNQLVKHEKFGIGLIKKAEKQDSSSFYLTICFKCGEKKILSSFVTKI